MSQSKPQRIYSIAPFRIRASGDKNASPSKSNRTGPYPPQRPSRQEQTTPVKLTYVMGVICDESGRMVYGEVRSPKMVEEIRVQEWNVLLNIRKATYKDTVYISLLPETTVMPLNRPVPDYHPITDVKVSTFRDIRGMKNFDPCSIKGKIIQNDEPLMNSLGRTTKTVKIVDENDDCFNIKIWQDYYTEMVPALDIGNTVKFNNMSMSYYLGNHEVQTNVISTVEIVPVQHETPVEMVYADSRQILTAQGDLFKYTQMMMLDLVIDLGKTYRFETRGDKVISFDEQALEDKPHDTDGNGTNPSTSSSTGTSSGPPATSASSATSGPSATVTSATGQGSQAQEYYPPDPPTIHRVQSSTLGMKLPVVPYTLGAKSDAQIPQSLMSLASSAVSQHYNKDSSGYKPGAFKMAVVVDGKQSSRTNLFEQFQLQSPRSPDESTDWLANCTLDNKDNSEEKELIHSAEEIEMAEEPSDIEDLDLPDDLPDLEDP